MPANNKIAKLIASKKSIFPIQIPKISHRLVLLVSIIFILAILTAAGFLVRAAYLDRQQLLTKQAGLELVKTQLEQQLSSITAQLQATSDELAALKADDQVVKNKKLEENIKNIQSTFQDAVTSYEEVITLRGSGGKTQPLEAEFALVLSQLGKQDYVNARKTLLKLTTDIETLKTLLATSGAIPADLKTSNTLPTSGYSRQVVNTDAGQFVIDIVAAELNSTKVQVETASAGDCKDNCPLGALADFVARSGGFAGINGPYFCPAEYPSCVGKTNSYDTLMMNKNKFYFNSDNNVYSVVPAFIFSGNGARVVNSSDAGRDSGVDAVIAAQPALVFGGQIAFTGDGDPKKNVRTSCSFIAVKGNTVYIGVVRAASVAEVAKVMKTLGVDNALNLDSGGSTAFMANGKYVAGPGRQTPFGIVLVRR